MSDKATPKTITARGLKRLIDRYTDASIALSWVGSQPVEDRPATREEAKLAKAALYAGLARLEEVLGA